MNRGWYEMVGVKITFTIFNFILFPFANLVTPIISRILNKKNINEKQLVIENIRSRKTYDLFIFDKFAKIMSMLFVTMSISSGLPIAIPTYLLLLVGTFFIEKYIFIKHCTKPFRYNKHFIEKIFLLLPVFLFAHCIIGLFTYGSKNIFPSEDDI